MGEFISWLMATRSNFSVGGTTVYGDLGLDYGRVEAARERPWIDIVVPSISGKRVDINLLVQTLEEWGGYNEVEKERRWREFAEAVTGLRSVHPNAANRLRGFCTYHFAKEDLISVNPRTKFWDRVEREAALHGRVPQQPTTMQPAVSYSDEQKQVYYDKNEHWVPLPNWPEANSDGLFRPGTSKL